jgi:hypothetical protein
MSIYSGKFTGSNFQSKTHCRVSQGQIGEYGNDRPLSIRNVQAKGTAFSSLVAEVLNQIATNKRVTL